MIAFVDLETQRKKIEESLKRRIDTVLKHGQFILGPEVQELEERLANFVGTKHCITVKNGTDALLIAMMALEIEPGDEVITTPFTFVATVETIMLLGAKPVFVDIDPKTYNLNAHLLTAAMSSKTKAIIPVSLYGQCADMDLINQIASQYKLPVIEDGAQSLGATYKGQRSCELSTIGCTSFFPSKPLGCYGDGGACFTNDDELAQKIKEIRVHGQGRRYYHQRLGMNSRFDTLQAAILLSKMEIFENEILLRQQVGERYTQELQDWVRVPHIEPWNTSVYAQYTIRVPQRSFIQQYLKDHGIPTAIHYPLPLHKQPMFKEKFPHENIFLPEAEKAAESVLSLPMHPYLTAETQTMIAQILQQGLLELATKKKSAVDFEQSIL